jgi:parallel beta-helix repeat protein
MDKNPLISKCLAVGIILLFVGTAVIPSIAQNSEKSSKSTSKGNWLYVGGSGPGNYTKIQDAIDNASDGDTVFVYHGIYSDYFPDNQACVYITKNINLIGENKYTTIINSSGIYTAVIIFAEYVNISGFTLQQGKINKSKVWMVDLEVIYYRAKDVKIFNNIITNTSRGVLTHQVSANIQIYNNIITNCYYGIDSEFDSPPLNIYNNTIANNEYGIYTEFSELTLVGNIITNNTFGIYMLNTQANFSVVTNEISHNKIGIEFISSKSTIKHNNFIQNEKDVNIKIEINIFILPLFLFYKQKWISNFYDDLNSTQPRIFLGNCVLYIFIPKFGNFDIVAFPYVEFDWHPAIKPYDIPG